MKKNKVKRKASWLFWIFIVVAALCLLVTMAEWGQQANGSAFEMTATTDGYQLNVSNMPATPEVYNIAIEAEGMPEGVKAVVHPATYDIHFESTDASLRDNHKSHWAIVLRYVEIVLIAACFVMGVIVAIGFYRSARRGQRFNEKNIHILSWIGVLMLCAAACNLVYSYLDSALAEQLMMGSPLQPHIQVKLPVSRIIFAVVVLFLSQVLFTNVTLHEEQELTI